MLDTVAGAVPMHAGNFTRAFRQLPAVTALGLRNNPASTPHIAESFARFLVGYLDSELQVPFRLPACVAFVAFLSSLAAILRERRRHDLMWCVCVCVA